MVTVRRSGDSISSRHGRVRGLVVCGVTWLLTILLPGFASSEEPAEKFLNALRERGYYDAALLYLDRMDGNPLVTPAFESELAYQRGVTMVQAATRMRDSRAREQMLNDAKASLEKFLAEQPDSPKRPFARRQFVLLLRQWAGMKVDAARRTEDESLLKEAGSLYDDVYKASVSAADELKAELIRLEDDPGVVAKDRKAIEYRDLLRGEYLLTLLRVAESLEEKADTEPEDSAARKKLLEQAIEKYDEMYTKYGTYLVALRARLYQARCLRKLGDDDTALGYLTDDLFTQTDENRPASRQLRTEALLLAMACWMDDAKKQYAKAISEGTKWLDTMRPAESEEPDWILLRLRLARANKLQADALAEQDPRDPLVLESRDAARRLARIVSRLPSEYQEQGRMLLAEIPGGVAVARVGEKEEPKNFEEARVRATEAISEMESAEYFLENVPERLRHETDEAVRKELQDKLKVAEETARKKRTEARQMLRLALSFADANTPIEDLNLVRRLLAYFYYVEGEYYDAAVMGEFIGRRYPGSSGARIGAQIALAAYLKLYETNPAEDKPFETNHIISLANYIVETWSGTAEAAEAINTLIPFLIRQGQLDKAREYVENIPPNTLERGSAELRIGEALWRDYLIGMQELREWEKSARDEEANATQLQAKIAARKPELDEVRKTALQILESGVQRMKESGTVNATVPRAVLSLAQIYVDTDQAPRAIELLDDQTIGVLPMIERGDPVMDEPRLREQAYRVALSAMVSALTKVENNAARAQLIDRCRGMIQHLRASVGDSPESQKRLVDVFVSLAAGMERQLKLLDKPADRRVLSQGFRTFLEQVRDEADDLRVLRWVADSFASLGRGLVDDPQSISAARECFSSAVSTYDQILNNAQKYKLDAELKRQLQFGKSLALRGAGKFAESAELLTKVLVEDNNRLEYQQEAARTFQLWAADPKEGIKYLTAIRGTKVDPETEIQAVWGWSRIASVTGRDKRYRDDFYEARYHTAVCHYELALRLRDKAKRTEYLQRARNDLVYTQRLYPSLGGQKWYSQYNALLKRVQQSLGERPAGFVRTSRK